MTMLALSPFTRVPVFNSRINRIFDDFFTDEPLSNGTRASHWNPVADIYNNEKTITIHADLPGMTKEDISINVENRVLTLKGKRSYEDEVKEENFYRKERAFGTFQRSFTLPESVDTDSIRAEFKDGVLKIEIPKPEEKKTKEITIN